MNASAPKSCMARAPELVILYIKWNFDRGSFVRSFVVVVFFMYLRTYTTVQYYSTETF